MSNRRLLWISLALVLAGAAVAAEWIRVVGDLDDLTLVRRLHVSHVVLLGLTGASVLLRFFRWQYLLRRGGIRLPARPSLLIYLASLVGTATPAYVGEAIRGVFIRGRFGVPVSTTVFVLVFERLLDLVALAVIAGLLAGGWWLAAAAVMLLIVAPAALVFLRGLGRIVKVPEAVLGITARPGILAGGMLISLVAWLLVCFHVSLAAASLPEVSVAALDSARIFSSSILLGGLTLMPAGIGATGTLAILQLESLGTALPDAVMVVSVLRLTTTWATLAAGALCMIAVVRERRARIAADAAEHFDDIATEYDSQFSLHVWRHLLDRKVGIISGALPPPSASGTGLDLGCGLGNQCRALGERGFDIIGMDASRNLARRARRNGTAVTVGTALALPFRDGSLGFVYTVGVLHHLPDRRSQDLACREVQRVLRPGGRFIVHETNPRNPLFRFYMGYVFPLLKSIDEGTEWWIPPEYWAAMPGFRVVGITHFTFMPDFVPVWLMGPMRAIDRWLEASRLRRYSVHYAVVLERDPVVGDTAFGTPFAEPASRHPLGAGSNGSVTVA